MASAMVALLAGTSFVLMAPGSSGSALTTQHEPISIVGDSDFTVENGVTGGSGTSADPYIIEGWEIGPNEKNISLQIMNSRAYFTIRNVFIFTADIGISMTNVTHGRVENSMFFSTSIGVSMYNSDSCKVTLSTFELNQIGIMISYCDATQSKNTFIDCVDNVKKLEHKESLITTWVGTAVCVAALIPLILFLGLLIYYRMQNRKMNRQYPPVQ